MEKICGIYCIENKINQKKYIGQSKNILLRWKNHKYELRNNKHGNIKLQRSWNKYGEDNFDFYVLKECTNDDIDDCEIYYIQYFDSVKNGYNIEYGGNGKRIISDETRAKMSESMKRCYAENRFSFSFMPKTILQIDFNGNIIKKWICTPEIIEAMSTLFDASSIRRCLTGEYNQHNGFIWLYENNYEKLDLNLCLKNKKIEIKPVYQYDFFGNFIFKWDKPKDAEVNGFNRSMISAVCNGIKKSHKGYIWSYEKLTKEQVLQIVSKIPQYIITRNTPDKKVM